MVDANNMNFIDMAMGVGDPYSYNAVSDMLTRGGNYAAAAGGGAAFNCGSGLSSWLGSINPAARNNVVIYGDSNCQIKPAESYRWAQNIRAELLTLTGLASGGAGFRHLGLPEWSRTGTWTLLADQYDFNGVNSIDLGPSSFAYSALNTPNIMTWTLPADIGAHDRFDLYGIDDDVLALLQGSYSVNGGAFTDTAWDLGTSAGVRLVKQTIMGTITTTLRVRGSNTVLPNYYAGAAFYNGTTGLVVHNLAIDGGSVDTYAGGDDANRLAILDDLQPKLTIVWTGANEFHNGSIFNLRQMTLDRWYEQYTRIVERARQHGDVLMVFPQATQIPNALNPDVTRDIPETQASFQGVARTVALENDCGLLSVNQVWGPWGNADARGRMLDAHHLNQVGHEAALPLVARTITNNS